MVTNTRIPDLLVNRLAQRVYNFARRFVRRWITDVHEFCTSLEPSNDVFSCTNIHWSFEQRRPSSGITPRTKIVDGYTREKVNDKRRFVCVCVGTPDLYLYTNIFMYMIKTHYDRSRIDPITNVSLVTNRKWPGPTANATHTRFFVKRRSEWGKVLGKNIPAAVLKRFVDNKPRRR